MSFPPKQPFSDFLRRLIIVSSGPEDFVWHATAIAEGVYSDKVVKVTRFESDKVLDFMVSYELKYRVQPFDPKLKTMLVATTEKGRVIRGAC